MIKIENLSKHYPGTTAAALTEVTLTIETGAIFGILGRSGAGKSTLLRCLNRLERPSSGRILVDGSDIGQLSGAAASPAPTDGHDFSAFQFNPRAQCPRQYRPAAGDRRRAHARTS